MRDIPIIFSAPMVLALLREAREPGTGKSMTRRLAWAERHVPLGSGATPKAACVPHRMPAPRVDHVWVPSPWQNVKPGDRLWVRENFWHYGRWTYLEGTEKVVWTDQCNPSETPNRIHAADADPERIEPRGEYVMWEQGWYLKPSIHMPRTVSRLTLVVTETKIERLHQISRADVLAEGIPPEDIKKWEQWLHRDDCPGQAFGQLWDSLHGKGEWDKNHEIVAVRFKVHEANIDAMKEAA